MQTVVETQIPGLRLLSRGKVRDNYALDDALLIVTTDRISAFDHILPNGIPDKGKVLNQISLFWFEITASIVRNHVREHRVDHFPEALRPHADLLMGRSVVVARLEMLPIECVVRGYLSGSGYREYQNTGAVCGIRLPNGLEESARLPEPIFTPATKAVSGHDENIPFSRAVELVGKKEAERVRDLSLELYQRAHSYAAQRGIIIADTKFEFGRDGAELVLGDEVLTPDSSRFWPADAYRPGGPQRAYDKQFVRDYLESIGWDKNPPAPRLPDAIVQGTSERYREIYRRLTDRSLN